MLISRLIAPLFFIHLIVSQVCAQTDTIAKTEPVFTIVEEMPVFNKCAGTDKNEQERCTQSKLFQFFTKNLRYPEKVIDRSIHGTVYTSFVIDTTGEVTDVSVLKGLPGCEECDQEAVRLISSLPSFQPGKQRGKKVKVKYTLPIKFRILD